jgi:LPPG:FO 2-phospho-L-lactate transferase
MKAWGSESSSSGTFELYRDFTDLFIQDIRDTVEVPGSRRYDTLMTDDVKSTALARAIMQSIRNPD